MKIVKLATGFAIGYVLGSRAGRDAYEKIVVNVRQMREHPTVVQAQDKATALLSSGTETATEKLHQAAVDTAPDTRATATGKARAPRKSAATAPVEPSVGQPLL
ncbi:hypothetical protein [Mangrovihabitans endophyticus]|uniref:Uncharacterized protein n=1 Tax=Mangrovihabitans endophyticus TaxID=1751298 RepID=A0A8J3C3Q6_9ACTN|nr:hypothetical protein [Mangrovihabitans endophyticus]GGL10625.1 hypothetical protein GCM10012284_51720 [Mangrovihabitans endophyticus]